ncbi:MAG: outer membrane beta-barrel family protein, partial [Bacteroidota bacterium]|nr:outer membrane beta-barrel family protein [Bacteroidota bacterium]
YKSSSVFVVDPYNSDLFNFSQDVYSGYFMYSLKLKKVNFRLGARVEYTNVDGNFIASHTAIRSGYAAFLPNLQLTRKFSNVYSTVLTYSKRLNRPYIKTLNPFIDNSDSLNITFGNPQLKPQTTHNLSWQHRVTKGSFFTGITLTGAYSNNMIIQYTTFDKTTGVSSTTSANLGRSFQLSANANINLKLSKSWNLMVNGDIRYNHIQNNIPPYQLFKGVGGNGSINTYFKIGKSLTLSSNAGFLYLPVTAQVQSGPQYWYGSKMAVKMFKEKVTFSLNYTNFMDRYFDYKSTVKDLNFITTKVNTSLYRRLNVSLLWSFGKLKENVSKKKGVYNDDLLDNEKKTNQ